jgi:hypothetical protein
MKIRTIFLDILVGIPGGFLVVMGMLLFNTLITMLFRTSSLTMLIILCITSLVVGMLARLMRPIHGLGTAISAGVVAAFLVLYLRQASVAGTDMALVFGPLGMLVAILFTPLGAWVFPKFWKHPLVSADVPKNNSKK